MSKVKEVSVALELEPGDDYTVLMEGEFVYSTEQMEKMEAAYLKVSSLPGPPYLTCNYKSNSLVPSPECIAESIIE